MVPAIQVPTTQADSTSSAPVADVQLTNEENRNTEDMFRGTSSAFEPAIKETSGPNSAQPVSATATEAKRRSIEDMFQDDSSEEQPPGLESASEFAASPRHVQDTSSVPVADVQLATEETRNTEDMFRGTSPAFEPAIKEASGPNSAQAVSAKA